MRNLTVPNYHWYDLFLVALLLYLVWLLLRLVHNRLERGSLYGRYQRRVTYWVGVALLLYEPLTILTLVAIFVFINPLPHALLVLVTAALTFGRLRDYVSGRIVLFNPLIRPGKRFSAAGQTGVISRIGKVGLYLQQGEKLRFVNYTDLLAGGFSLSTGQEVGGFYQLNVRGPGGGSKVMDDLSDRLLTAPYLSRDFRPELRPAPAPANGEPGGATHIRARVRLSEERQLTDLLALLEEWGYPTTVAKK